MPILLLSVISKRLRTWLPNDGRKPYLDGPRLSETHVSLPSELVIYSSSLTLVFRNKLKYHDHLLLFPKRPCYRTRWENDVQRGVIASTQ